MNNHYNLVCAGKERASPSTRQTIALAVDNQVTENPWLSYHMSEVKTSVVSKPSAFLEELPLSEKQ